MNAVRHSATLTRGTGFPDLRQRAGRSLATLAALALGLGLLSGCAGLNTLGSEVSSYGEWPAGRQPGTYAFERLPSHAAKADAQQVLEDAARPALEAAGFKPAADAAAADVVIQVGARVSRAEVSPWVDPFWWRGPYRAAPYAYWAGPRWHPLWRDDLARVDREVALLIRDRSTGKPLYETRAVGGGSLSPSPAVLRAMFDAALKDFPTTGSNPRVVRVPMAD
jgi:hypothetical protein